jgi:hypothetical protein
VSEGDGAQDETRCGALTRAGRPCENYRMKNGRCRMHGGKSTGAPCGNVNRWKHGFYSNRLLPGESKLLKHAAVAPIDDEIALMRLMLQGMVRMRETPEVESAIEVMKAVAVIRELLLAKWTIEESVQTEGGQRGGLNVSSPKNRINAGG